VDQDFGQRQAEGQGEDGGEGAQQQGLGEDLGADLGRRRPGGAQDGQLAHAFKLQREQGGEHPDEGDRQGQRAQHRRDREGAVEHGQRNAADRRARTQLHRARVGEQFTHAALDGVQAGAGGQEDADGGDGALRPPAVVEPAVHEDGAAIGVVVVIDAGDGESLLAARRVQRDAVAGAGIVAHGPGFGDQHGRTFAKARPDALGLALLEADGVQAGGCGVECEQGHRAVAGFDFHAPAGRQRAHALEGAHALGQPGWQGREVARRDPFRAGEIEIRGQCALEPVGDGHAETGDHRADAHGGGQRHRERDHGEGRARQRRADALRRHAPQRPERPPQRPRQRRHQRPQQPGDDAGAAGDDRGQRGIAGGEAAAGPHDQYPSESQQAKPRQRP
jgi:hypothetical protein